MGARSDEIEVPEQVVTVVDAEIGALRQQRLKAKGGAEMGAEIGREVLGRVVERQLDPIAKPRHQPRLEDGKNAIRISRPFHIPIDVELAEMRDGRERIEGRATRRRHGRIGSSGRAAPESEPSAQA